MPRISLELIDALRKTAAKLESSSQYQWGHMGLCNCGFLAQEITKLRKEEIHQRAMQQHGDWSEQLNDYCPNSGMPMDRLIKELIDYGFDTHDLKHLEKLSDPSILRALPITERYLKHNTKPDVVLYFRTWASYLEDDLLRTITLPDIKDQAKIPA